MGAIIEPERRPGSIRADLLLLAAITLLAAFLRFWQLDIIPPGLHHDEAFHALQAREILLGRSLPIVLPGNYGTLPLLA